MATLARVREQQSYLPYKEMFYALLKQCHRKVPAHQFKFKGKIYLLGATTINLCLSVFPLASYRKANGAIKQHFDLDADGNLPVFMDMTEGKKPEIEWAGSLKLPAGSYVIFDRGYTNYNWYGQLDKAKITFMTRLKSNATAIPFYNRRKPDPPNILHDQKTKLPNILFTFRRSVYVDPETGIKYEFLTNFRKLNASEVTALYKERIEIELFIKWIKQNLKAKTSLGTSSNKEVTQPWFAFYIYLLPAFFKFMTKFDGSLSQILRLLQLNLFDRRQLSDLLRSPYPSQSIKSPQLLLWN